MARRTAIGDTFLLETGRGNVLLQFVYIWENGIELMRVLPGFYVDVPSDLEEVVNSREAFSLRFQISAANRLGLVKKIATLPVPAFYKIPIEMREPYTVKGLFQGWHIIDTRTLQRRIVHDLSASERKLSPWAIWNDTYLREQLESGWTLEKWGE